MNEQATSPNPRISTITEFLESTGARIRIFDMGRRITKLPRNTFFQFEQTELPYPYPMQQQAWIALIFQDTEQAIEPFIWFLRFPLDEQGKLLQAARDDFMHRLMERVGDNLRAAKEGDKLEAALKDNPYTFKPRDDRMAVFHAKAAQLFKQPASKYFTHAKQYFSGELGWDQWGFIGYQGIAELAAKQSEPTLKNLLPAAIPQLPRKPLEALCHCLENETVDRTINQALLDRMETLLQADEVDTQSIAACIRGVARSQSDNLKKALMEKALAQPVATSPDILAAISGRCWESLLEQQLRHRFLEQLADNDNGQAFFDQCLTDLLFIPGMRTPLLNSLRDPKRSEKLSSAIGAFFNKLTD